VVSRTPSRPGNHGDNPFSDLKAVEWK
jgi:hypothetical protein